jgi:hypothetical protein
MVDQTDGRTLGEFVLFPSMQTHITNIGNQGSYKNRIIWWLEQYWNAEAAVCCETPIFMCSLEKQLGKIKYDFLLQFF